MTDLILASSSPRRKELLAKLQIPFSVVTSKVDENFSQNQSPEEVVVELALRKAEAVSTQYPDSVIIGADTVVVLEQKILGKPDDRDQAKKMLQSLSGKTHTVLTGVAIVDKEQSQLFFEKTDVTFWELTSNEIDQYLNSGEPFDKAGAYGIQGLGSLFVQSIQGDFFSVVGLPISRLKRELSSFIAI
ncbi:Maf family protein [Heyndrickxia sp. NPDC080065]|uniref:Maf family protein n=1 Tax=Heyndrickxia sp. NPDC080065 TaxID=3390568 RepID=UPI003D009AFB